jgi:hypothetical protein
MIKAEREAIWAKRIEACKQSGMTKRAWCRENDVSIKGFYYWYNKNNKDEVNVPDKQVSFLLVKQVPASTPAAVQCAAISIQLGQATVRVTEGFSEESLTSVIRIVSNIC